jgi:hypothetical protein
MTTLSIREREHLDAEAESSTLKTDEGRDSNDVVEVHPESPMVNSMLLSRGLV